MNCEESKQNQKEKKVCSLKGAIVFSEHQSSVFFSLRCRQPRVGLNWHFWSLDAIRLKLQFAALARCQPISQR